MYATYLIHEPSGEIIGWLSDHEAPTEPGHLPSPTGAPIDGAQWYVAHGAVVEQRPKNPARLLGQHLNRLPAPCTITINGKAYECADQTAELGFTYPGTYKVTVSSFPYLDAQFEVTV